LDLHLSCRNCSAENVEFSADSPKGSELYRFDISLMERLADGGLPMSQLQVQRRMRPAISSLIRYVQLDIQSDVGADD
jgi:hypothetical protein